MEPSSLSLELRCLCFGRILVLFTALRQRGIALLYTTQPLCNVYHQIFPAIATFPVIPNNAPVWKLVEHASAVSRLRPAVLDGLASPNDQNEFGYTLLHAATVNFDVEACKLLIAMGADVNRTDVIFGYSPLGDFIEQSWRYLSHERPSNSTFSYQTAFEILEILLGAGSDTDMESWCFPQIIALKGIIANPTSKEMSTEWSALLNRNEIDIVGDIMSERFLLHPLGRVPYIIMFLLQCGMNPDHAYCGWPTLIFALLEEEHTLSVWGWWDEMSGDQALSHLLAAGADIYKIAWESEFKSDTTWNVICGRGPIFTSTTFATASGTDHRWRKALRKAGFDPSEAYAEDERRRNEFLKSHRAVSTGVHTKESELHDSTLRLRTRKWP